MLRQKFSIIRGLTCTCAFICISVTSASASSPGEPQLVYAEEGEGISTFFLSVGPMNWLTQRDPLAPGVPTAITVGYGHQIGQGRLAWRASWAQLGAQEPIRFIYIDLLSIESIWQAGPLRPFGRTALGVGLDLIGERLTLGQDGYFNAENGASGGFGLTAGAGLDWMVTNTLFARIEGDIRTYGGAGRMGVLWSASAGLGVEF